MVLQDKDKKQQFELMIAHRNTILESLNSISKILEKNFPEEYNMAYQHWIPQIHTALNNNDKWLPRGMHNFSDTINAILDKEFNK